MISYDKAKQIVLRKLIRKKDFVFIGQGLVNPRTWGGLLKRLSRKYANRLINYPLSETSISGVAVGMALDGLRPCVFFPRHDFALLAVDGMVNSAVYWKYMFGEQFDISVTFWLLNWKGARGGYGAQHVNNYASWFASLPKVKVYAPSMPSDIYNALIESYRDGGVKFVIDNVLLSSVEEDEEDFEFNADGVYGAEARVVKEGEDITLVSYSSGVIEMKRVAEEMERKGMSPELIDLRLLKPIDVETIEESVRKTGKLVVIDTGWKSCGIASEVIALLKERGLEFEAQRLSYPEYPVPSSPYLEEKYYVLR